MRQSFWSAVTCHRFHKHRLVDVIDELHLIGPFPVADFRQIVTEFMNVVFVF
jgi:hypothetical protein